MTGEIVELLLTNNDKNGAINQGDNFIIAEQGTRSFGLDLWLNIRYWHGCFPCN